MAKESSAFKEFVCPYSLKKYKVKIKKEEYEKLCETLRSHKGLPVRAKDEVAEELESEQKKLEKGYGKRLKK